MFSPKVVFEVFRKKGGKCYYCGEDAETLDHFIPRAKGGPNTIDNYIPACRKCNGLKKAFDIETFRQIRIRKLYNIPYFKKEQLEWLEKKGFRFEQYQHLFFFETHNLEVPKNA